MINRRALERIGHTNLTKNEEAAILTCDTHKTEFLLVFNSDLMFDETMDDDALGIMLHVLHPKMLSEIRRLTTGNGCSMSNETALTCLRYLNACVRIDIQDANKLDNNCLKDVQQYI